MSSAHRHSPPPSGWESLEAFAHRPRVTEGRSMSAADAQRILDWLDTALELFHVNRGRLNAQEIRILSMIAVARQELAAIVQSPGSSATS
jgi:hypothetical protein